MHYVIVGNGVCGIEAALALRGRDASARITLVSDEHDHFFSRPALMYVFAGQTTLRDTEPYDRELYERLRFERVRKRVASVDPRRTPRLRRRLPPRLRQAPPRGGLAARAPLPGRDPRGPGVHYFVTLRDLEGLDAEAKPGSARWWWEAASSAWRWRRSCTTAAST